VAAGDIIFQPVDGGSKGDGLMTRMVFAIGGDAVAHFLGQLDWSGGLRRLGRGRKGDGLDLTDSDGAASLGVGFFVDDIFGRDFPCGLGRCRWRRCAVGDFIRDVGAGLLCGPRQGKPSGEGEEEE